MASNIVYDTIDEAYPVAGVDNDTQGFRDNFAIIKTALTQAATELSQLNEFGVRVDQTSAFNGTAIEGPELRQWTQQVIEHANVESSQYINWSAASYQTFPIVEDAIQFTLDLWREAGTYGELTAAFKSPDDQARTITFDAAGGGTIKYGPGFPDPITVSSSTDPIIIKFWTHDSGGTIYAQYLGTFS